MPLTAVHVAAVKAQYRLMSTFIKGINNAAGKIAR